MSVSPPAAAAAASPSAVAGREAAKPPSRDEARQQLNASIVQASLSVSLSAGDEPLSLLLSSVIGQLNEVLEPEFGANAIQNALGQDNTPAATAARIVSLSTGFLEGYSRQHPELEGEALIGKFMDTIRGGFEQGYREAQGILKGLGVLSGDVAGGIEETYALVLKGYADFEQAQKQAPAA
ncbi:MAG TPA: DUF5610 domain-containing protein [Solimonas sp.]|nr:DUF5610 domain-containing protein [Solimonas sp.]